MRWRGLCFFHAVKGRLNLHFCRVLIEQLEKYDYGITNRCSGGMEIFGGMQRLLAAAELNR